MHPLEPTLHSSSFPTGEGGLTVIRILIDPVAWDAYGYCAELLPEAIPIAGGVS